MGGKRKAPIIVADSPVAVSTPVATPVATPPPLLINEPADDPMNVIVDAPITTDTSVTTEHTSSRTTIKELLNKHVAHMETDFTAHLMQIERSVYDACMANVKHLETVVHEALLEDLAQQKSSLHTTVHNAINSAVESSVERILSQHVASVQSMTKEIVASQQAQQQQVKYVLQTKVQDSFHSPSFLYGVMTGGVAVLCGSVLQYMIYHKRGFPWF
jgi:hypothetical protein